MNNLSSGRITRDQGVHLSTPIVARRILIWAAWISTLLLSKLPLVVARDLVGTDIPWITPAWAVTATLLFAATFIWQSLKPLRSYFIVIIPSKQVNYLYDKLTREKIGSVFIVPDDKGYSP